MNRLITIEEMNDSLERAGFGRPLRSVAQDEKEMESLKTLKSVLQDIQEDCEETGLSLEGNVLRVVLDNIAEKAYLALKVLNEKT